MFHEIFDFKVDLACLGEATLLAPAVLTVHVCVKGEDVNAYTLHSPRKRL